MAAEKIAFNPPPVTMTTQQKQVREKKKKKIEEEFAHQAKDCYTDSPSCFCTHVKLRSSKPSLTSSYEAAAATHASC